MKVIDRYPVLSLLGEGGMGTVYMVQDPDREERLALKLLRRDEDPSGLGAARFRREFRLMSTLHHPNLVRVYRFDLADGLPFFTMELVHGETLSQHPAFFRPVGSDLWGEHRTAVFEILLQMLNALEYIHLHGIIHRDIKPSNILITPDGVVKMMDFGLAREVFNLDSNATPQDWTVGTLEYCSPEQLGGSEGVDTRSDLYSLGVLLFELTCGQSPYVAGSSLLQEVLYGAPLDPREINPAVPAPLAELMLRCLQRERDQRPSAVAEVRTALLAFATSQGLSLTVDAAHPLSSAGCFFVPKLLLPREAESTVGAFLADLLAGFNRVLFVDGADGCGKSRLADHVSRIGQRKGVTVLRSRPGQAWLGLPVTAESGDLHETMSRRLIALSETQPVLMVVDDVHLLDADSLRLLLYLLRDVGARPPGQGRGVGFACCFCPGGRIDTIRPDFQVSLVELDVTLLTDYLAETLGDPEGAAELARRLHEAVGGNPALVVETLRALATAGRLRFDGVRWALEGQGPIEDMVLPSNLQAVYQKRLEGLSNDALAALRCGALLGPEFSFDMLRRVMAPVSNLAVVVDDLVMHRLLATRRGVSLGFPQASLRQYLLSNLAEAEAVSLRRGIVDALQAVYEAGDRSVLSALALHTAALGADDRAIGYLLAAAAEAQQAQAHEQAADLYAEALRVAGGRFEALSIEVRTAMNGVLMAAGRFQRAAAVAEFNATAATDPVDRARWLHMVGRARMGGGHNQEALSCFQASLAVLDVRTPQDGAALAGAVAWHFLQHLPDVLHPADESHRPAATPAQRVILRVLADLPNLFYFVHIPHREAFFFNAILQAVHLAGTCDDPDLATLIQATYAFMLIMAPHPPVRIILGLLSQVDDRLRGMTEDDSIVEVSRFSGYSHYLLGNCQDAPMAFRLGREAATRSANARGMAQCGTLYALSLWWRGSAPDMEEAARAALHKCQVIDDGAFEPLATAALAVSMGYQGRRPEGDRLLAAALQREQPGVAEPLVLMFAQAWLAAVARDDDDAWRRLEEVQVRWAASYTDHIHPARAGLLAAQVALRLLQRGRLPLSVELEHKLQGWMKAGRTLGSGVLYVAGHVKLVEAQWLTFRGRLRTAEEVFEQGVALVRTCGAVVLELDGRLSWAEQLLCCSGASARRKAERELDLVDDLAVKLGITALLETGRRLRAQSAPPRVSGGIAPV